MDAPGTKRLAVVACISERIVGALGSTAARLKTGQQIWVGGWDGDYFVEKDYRKGNTLFRLVKLAAQLKQEQGMDFSFGVPVEDMKKISVTILNSKEIGRVRKFVKVLNVEPFISERLKKKWPVWAAAQVGNAIGCLFSLPWTWGKSRYSVREIDHFDDSFDCFWSEIADKLPVGFVRDTEYLNWRFVAIPGIKYKILKAEDKGRVLGYCVLRVRGDTFRRGYIMDIVAGDIMAFQDLMKAALRYFRSCGVDIVIFWFLGPRKMTNTLKGLGFVERHLDRTLTIQTHNPRFPVELAGDPNNWYLTTADCDMF